MQLKCTRCSMVNSAFLNKLATQVIRATRKLHFTGSILPFCRRMTTTNETLGYTKGSQPPPEVSTEDLRLYSMRFCPYAARVRLVLNFKNLKYEVINVNLKLGEKPEWYFTKNALGKVPLLEEKGAPERLFESAIVAEYLDDKFHADPLLPKDDPLERARQKMLVEVIHSKITAHWHPLMMKDDVEKKAILVKALEYVEDQLAAPYFSGEALGFADLMVWPWFERLPAVEQFRGIAFNAEKYPKLFAWTQRIRQHPQLKTSIYPTELHLRYLHSRNFNEGLENKI